MTGRTFQEAGRMRWLLMIPVTAALAGGQVQVGVVEVFGAKRASVERIRKALGVSPGDPLPKSKGEAEERLEALDGVVRANLEAWCCEQGKAVLYVGIEERGAPHFELRPVPADDSLELPEEMIAAYGDFAGALARATAEGDLGEDLSRGHSLMQWPAGWRSSGWRRWPNSTRNSCCGRRWKPRIRKSGQSRPMWPGMPGTRRRPRQPCSWRCGTLNRRCAATRRGR